ncbi:amidohydrolase family protein [Halalkalibacter okhensis]|uniref:Amidohydrolase n=1 Tax=Halalkalibacter okhensis TaxID=333138 RepID=A0A0B0IGC5_9BACI|nr:amidohydrolase family protein [Halalkalibacter okhensis]KHF41658.1 amidohydrolase [Halalkalibacter okhensis]
MRIDAHQHYWNIDREDYGWIKPDNQLMYRNYYPADLLPHLKNQNINKTILIQAAPTIDETIFLLELSKTEETVAAVIGWLDLTEHNFKEKLNMYRKYAKFAGIRVMIQDMKDETVVLTPPYVKAFKYFEEINLPIDLLVTHDQLDTLIKLMEKVPNLRGVIDHIGKPNISNKYFDSWYHNMKGLSKYPNLYCKTSGMITEASQNWEIKDFKPYLRAVLELFSIDRLMYGSDWPVCLMAGFYDDTVNVVMGNLEESLNSEEINKLFGQNASIFYELEK